MAAAALGLLLFHPTAQSQGPLEAALASFLGPDPSTFAFDLDKFRPAAEPPALRRALQRLPVKGHVRNLNRAQQAKLDSIEPILRLHQRPGTYEIRVYEDPVAAVSSRPGAVLLISTAALGWLAPGELQAAVAHEIGHEYVWREKQDAAARGDHGRVQELELICDGVALLTLHRVGVNLNSLLNGIESMLSFNFIRTRRAPQRDTHPSLYERKKFARAVMERMQPRG